MDILKQLDQAILKVLKALNGLDVGTEEHKVAADCLAKLMEKRAEFTKLENERAEKAQQFIADRNARIVGYIMTGAGIVLPLVVTVWGTMFTVNFEEHGINSTTAGRNFFNRLFAKK